MLRRWIKGFMRRGGSARAGLSSNTLRVAIVAICLGVMFAGIVKDELIGNDSNIVLFKIAPIGDVIGKAIGDMAIYTHINVISYLDSESKHTDIMDLLNDIALNSSPYIENAASGFMYEVGTSNESTLEMILRDEANDENHIDENGSLIKRDETNDDTLGETDTVDLAAQENEAARTQPETEDIETKDNMSNNRGEILEKFKDFDTLFSTFYTIDKYTSINETQLNIKSLLSTNLALSKESDKPQILIYHTHSQEAFRDSEYGNEAQTIVGAGDKLAEILREKYGYNVIHDKGKYDIPDRDYAYQRAAPELEKILAENPDIEVIIDLHRDGVAAQTRLVTEINGKQTAQFMLFNGISRTKQHGDILYLQNQYINENLAFAFRTNLAANLYYPGITRKIYLKGYRYNMHYRAKSLLVELGAQTNTVEEIMNAIEPLAFTLNKVLKEEDLS